MKWDNVWIMSNSTNFKLQIFKYTLAIAVLFEAGSLPLLGFSVEYTCGLLAGTVVSMVSFSIMLTMSKRILSSGQKWMASAGYMLRLPIYGLTFFICIKVGGIIAAIACLLGFITVTVAIIFVHGIIAKDREKEAKTWKN